ncbi:AMP-binding protein, partial [Streptomyces sp. NPDC054835]
MTAVLPEPATLAAPSAVAAPAPLVGPADCACAACAAGTGHADLLARLATAPGGRTAVVAADRSLTFDELRAEATAVAARLTALGAGPESVVALCLPRGAGLVTALIGTLTAGAAYLPLSPDYPEDRLRYMIEDSGTRVIVTQDRLRDRLAALA